MWNRLFCYLILLTVCFSYTSQVSAFSTITPNDDLVLVAPYDSIGTGAGDFGVSESATKREFITIGSQYRIRQGGSLSRVRLYTDDTTNLTGMYIKVWRKNGSTYDLVGTSNNIAGDLVSEETTTIDLSSPITGVQEGDYMGALIESSGGDHFHLESISRINTYYVEDTDLDDEGVDWMSIASVTTDRALPIELYMQAPQMVFIGDSITAGAMANLGALWSIKVDEIDYYTDIESTFAYKLGAATGYSYQNMGIGGNTTTQILARFDSHLLALKPKIAILQGGVNDFWSYNASSSKNTFLSNWTDMLDAVDDDADIEQVIVLGMLPYQRSLYENSGFGPENGPEVVEDWNDALESLVGEYAKASFLDATPYIADTRAGGDENNLWDIKADYRFDHIHYNEAGNKQLSYALIDVLDPTAPTLSGISASTEADSVTVSWSTDEVSSSQINYGLTSSYGSSTTASDTIVRTTDHSASLTGLFPCTQYHYRVRSTDPASEEVVSSDQTFTTACNGGAAVLDQSSESVTIASGGSLSLLESGYGVSLSIPAAFSNADAEFQIKQLSSTDFVNAIGHPSGKFTQGEYVYDFSAFPSLSTQLTNFDLPLSLSFMYNPSDMTQLDEARLSVYSWDGTNWSSVPGCNYDFSANTISCSIDHFSVYALFAELSASQSSGNGGGGSSRKIQKEEQKDSSLSLNTKESFSFARNLILGDRGSDVRALQKFLNEHNFIVASRGAGSPGHETDYFGPATKAALIRFQSHFQEDILAPLGLTQATGYFGASTRHFINQDSEVIHPVLVTAKERSLEIQKLQETLNALGYTVSETGPGSPGRETNYFGPLTKAALIRYQKDRGLSVNGLFDESTRAALFSEPCLIVINDC